MPKAKTTTKTPKTAVIRTAQSRQFTGTVVSAPGHKTAYVVVRARKMHDKYQKQYFTNKKYPIHDEQNVAKVGQTVIFQECRPLSKTKRWRFVRVAA